jgi:hypothetical protein
MSDSIKPDMSCVPYKRKGLYLVLTLPFLALLIAVFIYLWTFSFIFSMAFLLFFLAMCYFQAYCCACQDCPYIGGFCPAIVGIMPANVLAKLIHGKKKIIKSKKSFERNVTLASLCWLGLIVFPLFWIAKFGALYAGVYVACHVIYYVIFGLTICPVCAIRNSCPGGKLQGLILKDKYDSGQVG